ncbi:hypothetical protein [Legionella wadsworthii]|uniref:hypothetical protein n=1 Tax=Legionella wadsworthii TaxID=28088 RepID=UPI00105446FF|nr:hypothetical protein [Legionella wadsworthii]
MRQRVNLSLYVSGAWAAIFASVRREVVSIYSQGRKHQFYEAVGRDVISIYSRGGKSSFEHWTMNSSRQRPAARPRDPEDLP